MAEIPQPDAPKADSWRGAGRPRVPIPPLPPIRDMGALAGGIILPESTVATVATVGLGPRQKEYFLSLLAEKRKRQFESLRLYEPLPCQSAFHTSMARSRIARGSNRSGKTTATCVELAWAATGTHPQAGKYPERDGLAIVVAKDLDKIGEVIWRKLGRAGAFQIVFDPDPDVGWRAERPGDKELGLKSKPAPPLIPARYIREIAWESKKSNIPKKVMLHTGWEISFYSSKSDPFSIQGTSLDVVCLAGKSEVYDPVAGRTRRIDEIDGPFHVQSWNEKAGRHEVRPASRPFIKGHGEICRVDLSNGETIFTTRHHRVLTADGRYVSVQEAWEGGVALKAAPRIAAGYHGDAILAAPSRATCRTLSPSGRSSARRRASAPRRPAGISAHAPSISPCCAAGHARPDSPVARGFRWRCESSPRRGGGRFLPVAASGRGVLPSRACVPTRNHSSRAGAPGCRRGGIRRRRFAASWGSGSFAAWDRCVGVRCRPRPSLAVMVRPTSRVLSRPPRGSSSGRGTAPGCVPGRPSVSARSRRAFGWGCPRPSATSRGSCRPSCSGGSASRSPSPPRRRADGVPPCRERRGPGRSTSRGTSPTSCTVSSGSWCGSGDELNTVYIINVTRDCEATIWDIHVPVLHNYNYGGMYNHNCFDEEIVHASWFPEATARLLDRMGWFMWGATPQTGTQQLFDLHLRAEASAEEKEESPLVEEFFLSLWDNPHIDERAKRDFVEGLDEEERRVRVDGEFAISGLRVYEGRFFPRTTHCVEAFDVPDSWTRFAAIDPGSQVGAVLFGAVPPKKPDDPAVDPSLYGEYLYLYDEIFLRGCDAAKLAAKMKQTIGGQRIHTFLIDHHGGSLREIGSGKMPEQQYKDAFRKEKVACETTGHGFTWGSDDLDGGILRVKEFLRTREDGTPRLRMLKGRCPQFIKQMTRYQWKVVGGEITDKPLPRGCDLADCLRYLCQYPGLKYVVPRKTSVKPRGAYESYLRSKERRAARDRESRESGVTLG